MEDLLRLLPGDYEAPVATGGVEPLLVNCNTGTNPTEVCQNGSGPRAECPVGSVPNAGCTGGCSPTSISG